MYYWLSVHRFSGPTFIFAVPLWGLILLTLMEKTPQVTDANKQEF
jgi:hypothetical protein